MTSRQQQKAATALAFLEGYYLASGREEALHLVTRLAQMEEASSGRDIKPGDVLETPGSLFSSEVLNVGTGDGPRSPANLTRKTVCKEGDTFRVTVTGHARDSYDAMARIKGMVVFIKSDEHLPVGDQIEIEIISVRDRCAIARLIPGGAE